MEIHSLDEHSRDFPVFIPTPVNIGAWKEAPQAQVKLPTNRKLVILHGKTC